MSDVVRGRQNVTMRQITVSILGALAGCYPHSQAYRGAFSGQIVDDADGRPVPGATVIVCRAEQAKVSEDCPHRAEAWTDPEGRFSSRQSRRRQWCCFGEAPLPPTHLTACARDATGRFLQASSVTIDASGATEPRIAVAPSRDQSAQNACAMAR